jgi:hypothetical protein
MVKAKTDKKPIVYIGFGSITVPNPHKVTEIIVASVLKSTRVPILWEWIVLTGSLLCQAASELSYPKGGQQE